MKKAHLSIRGFAVGCNEILPFLLSLYLFHCLGMTGHARSGMQRLWDLGWELDSYHGPAVRCEFAERGHRLRQEECLYFTVVLCV